MIVLEVGVLGGSLCIRWTAARRSERVAWSSRSYPSTLLFLAVEGLLHQFVQLSIVWTLLVHTVPRSFLRVISEGDFAAVPFQGVVVVRE